MKSCTFLDLNCTWLQDIHRDSVDWSYIMIDDDVDWSYIMIDDEPLSFNEQNWLLKKKLSLQLLGSS